MKCLVFLCFLATSFSATPVVLWHGLGDYYDSPGMTSIAKLISNQTGAYVHNVRLNNDSTDDQIRGWFSNVQKDLDEVYGHLLADENLRGPTPGSLRPFHLMGLSQGGLFSRTLIQKFGLPVVNLISIGGPQMGVFGVPSCETEGPICDEVAKLVVDLGMYSDVIQDTVVPAQYYSDILNIPDYLAHSHYLAQFNNRNSINSTYISNLLEITKFVMVMFESDTVVRPKESEHWGFFKPGDQNVVIPMNETVVWEKDLIGLQKLTKEDKMVYLSCPGNHLQFTKEWFINNIIPFCK